VDEASDHKALLRDAADQSRLLEGENPESTHPEDVLLWLGVYAELLDLTGKLLGKMDADVVRTGEAYRDAAADLTTIERKQRRYRRRLAYWEARARELDRPMIHLSDNKS
jgi:hypothetical protein